MALRLISPEDITKPPSGYDTGWRPDHHNPPAIWTLFVLFLLENLDQMLSIEYLLKDSFEKVNRAILKALMMVVAMLIKQC